MSILTVTSGEHFVGSDVQIVAAYNDALIQCFNGDTPLTVLLFDKARCCSRANCSVEARDKSVVYACGGRVDCFDESRLEAVRDAVFAARNHSQVTAKDNATGRTFDCADLRALDNSQVLVLSTSKTEVRDTASVHYAPLGVLRAMQVSGDTFEKLIAALEEASKKQLGMGTFERKQFDLLIKEINRHELTAIINGIRYQHSFDQILKLAQIQKVLYEFGFVDSPLPF